MARAGNVMSTPSSNPLPAYPWYALVDDPADVVVVESSTAHDGEWPVGQRSTVVATGILDRVRSDRGAAEQGVLADAIFDLVRPGGEVWLSVGNRLSVLHFFGVRPAYGRPFEPLLPRCVTAIVRRLAPSSSELRSAVLTRRSYRRLLESAGFHEVEFLLAFFDASEPDFVVTSSPSGSLRRYLRSVRYSRSRRARLAMEVLIALERTHLIDHLAPAFIITARRPAA